MSLATQFAEQAKKIHAEMHVANSVKGEWHDDRCLHGVKI